MCVFVCSPMLVDFLRGFGFSFTIIQGERKQAQTRQTREKRNGHRLDSSGDYQNDWSFDKIFPFTKSFRFYLAGEDCRCLYFFF